MGLRFDPVGGGQFKEAVRQIIEAEKKPIKAIEERKARDEAKLKLFQDFKSRFAGVDKALAEISTFNKFREFKVDLGDGANSIGVTVDKEKCQPGTYSIEVESLAKRTAGISNSFESPDETGLGMGYIRMYGADGEDFEIFIDHDQGSLSGVAKAINQDPRSPVRASVVRDAYDPDEPWRLIVTAKKEGAEKNVDFPDFYFLDGEKDFYLDDNQEAENAILFLDGFEIETAGNQIPDFLPGVNLSLKQARPGQPFTITITEDHQKVAGKMKELVTQLNQVLSFITQQNQIDEKTDTRTTFAGDTGLQSVEYRLRNLLHEGFPVFTPDGEDFRIVHLHDMGVEFAKSGALVFNEDKFAKGLERDFDGVAEAITGKHGFAFQMRETLSGYTRSNDGFLGLREQSMRSRIKDLDRQIDDKNRNLDRRHQALTEQFSRLQASLANLQRQGQYVAAALPSGGGGGNIVSQLLGG